MAQAIAQTDMRQIFAAVGARQQRPNGLCNEVIKRGLQCLGCEVVGRCGPQCVKIVLVSARQTAEQKGAEYSSLRSKHEALSHMPYIPALDDSKHEARPMLNKC